MRALSINANLTYHRNITGDAKYSHSRMTGTLRTPDRADGGLGMNGEWPNTMVVVVFPVR